LFWSLLAFEELSAEEPVEVEDPAFAPTLPDEAEEPVFEAMLPDVVSEVEPLALDPLGLALALLAPFSQRP
jgi:hypothetical protein